MDFQKSFKAARRVSVPLVAVRTPDPASTVRTIVASLNSQGGKPSSPIAVLHWDVMRGIIGVNPAGKQEAKRLLGDGDPIMVSAKPTDMLDLASKIAEDSILFMANPQLFWNDPVTGQMIVQGIWNLREPYKAKGATLVMLTTGGATLPPVLAQDVLVLDEPYPTEQELTGIIEQTFKDANLQKPKQPDIDKAIDAVIGLASFPAEQTLAMSLTPNGLEYDNLWERKRQAIEQAKGLTVWRGTESLDDIGGYEALKLFAQRLKNSKNPPGCVVYMDEIEKHFAGSGTDLSGVKTGMEGAFLSWTQDKKVGGSLFLGPPGVGKSVFAKAFGRLLGVPTIQLDFDGMQESLVGKSGENLRNALKIIDAISRNRPFMIGACNSVNALSAAVRRRFKMGTFFVDLPSAEERDKIWKIYLAKYKLKEGGGEVPSDIGWTGAEIEECVRKADDFSISLRESSKSIIPVSVSMKEDIKRQRQEASGRYLSATVEGVYEYKEEEPSNKPTRKIKGFDIDGLALTSRGTPGSA